MKTFELSAQHYRTIMISKDTDGGDTIHEKSIERPRKSLSSAAITVILTFTRL